ncbi:hypothetical protein MalM25_15080 [Planctomycetes bacterium MalM25]|nr:hypothetical protein MalM25_15080 [Planctomycetes bacterium MalM25]
MVKRTHQPRRGAALLMSLFLVFMVSALVLNVMQTETLQLAATRNAIEYEQALYWANAGVHHACVELMNDPGWRGAVSEGTAPPSPAASGYSATGVDDGSGGVLVTSIGYSGQGMRTVQATIEL